MYGYKWEYHFTVTDMGNNRSRVQLKVEGETKKKKRHIIREFALLDSMLVGEAQIEIEDNGETEVAT
jgi:hypothetical protein